MPNLILPQSVTRNLPFAVTAQLAELPEQAQKEFFDEFNRKARTAPIGYLLHFLAGANYAYLNKWILQLLFWATGWGFGIWWVIDLFRIPNMIKVHNRKVADEALKNVLLRHKYYDRNRHQSPRSLKPSPNVAKPREFKTGDGDFVEFSIANLQIGYGFEYGLDTWEAVEQNQYDWDNGTSERMFRLASLEGLNNAFLILKKQGEQLVNIFTKKINIYALDEAIEDEIINTQRPRNIISYDGVSYFRENRKQGLLYKNINSQQPKNQKVVSWEYYDENRTEFLRIEQLGKRVFEVRIGKIASDYEFTDIYKMK